MTANTATTKQNNGATQKRRKKIGTGITIFLFLLPALLLFVGILIAPIAVSIDRSLYDWNGFSEGTFIGLQNYKELFTNGSIKFMTGLKNSMILAFFSWMKSIIF